MAIAATPGPRSEGSIAKADGLLPTGTAISIGGVAYVNVAGYEVDTFASGLTSTGTTQATAYTLTKNKSIFTSVAASSGVIIPNAGIGIEFMITNRGTNTLAVYPFSSGIIDAGSANVSVTISSNTTKRFIIATATQIYTTQST